MRLRWAVLMGLADSFALAWALGTYNGSAPPPYADWRAVIGWPTGNMVTLFLLLALIWFACLLCVSWKGSRVPGWQAVIAAVVILASCGSAAYLLDGIWKLVRR